MAVEFIPAEAGPVRELLRGADLPADDFIDHLALFIMAREGDRVVGAVGLEDCGSCGLLRSLVVADGNRGQGLGRELVARIMDRSRSLNHEQVLLLTTTVPDFFSDLGFERLDRDQAPETIKGTKEYAGICPVSAVLMRKRL